jgi:hypothetical protein
MRVKHEESPMQFRRASTWDVGACAAPPRASVTFRTDEGVLMPLASRSSEQGCALARGRVIRRQNPLREKFNFVNQIKLIWVVQSSLQKYIASGRTQITAISHAVSFPHEGRIAIVTDVGNGMRWTRQRRLRKTRLQGGP